MQCRTRCDLQATTYFHDQIGLHQINALSVYSAANREADVIDVRRELDDSLAASDRNFPPNHLVAAVATPDRGAIGARQQIVRVHIKPQRLVMTGCQVAGDCVLGTRNHEASDPVHSLIERETETHETRRHTALG